MKDGGVTPVVMMEEKSFRLLGNIFVLFAISGAGT
jgi:hypothetical protein